jgi:hypothetical protein
MNPAASLAEPLANTALARWLQTGWAFPIVESVHILSFARLLGLMRHGAIEPLLRSALPVALVGFCAAVASGTLLFVANAGELLANRAFVVKVALLMFAGLNAAAFHASAAKEALRTTDAPGPGMRAAGAASLLLWASVIVAGRLIAYI